MIRKYTLYGIEKFVIIVMFLLFAFNLSAQKDCDANFSFSVDQNRPNIIHFNDESIGDITSWNWDFGDLISGGSYSSDQNPIHTFPENGSYLVKLSISGDSCDDTVSYTIEIEVPLSIDFTFKLDSNNIIPNTFLFNAEIEGYYDELIWDFNNETVIANKEDTIHSYTEQDTDYQVCLMAKYFFNDTSVQKKVLCKGLTTYEYFNVGGQVYIGDVLLNNPTSTGDTAVAYLYRIDGEKMTPIDTNYYTHLGYYWFAQKLKAYYIIKTALLPNSAHYDDFAPTYMGNTTVWEEAAIVNLAQDKYREDIRLVDKNKHKEGSAQLEGSVYDLLDIEDSKTKAVVCLYDMENDLVDYQYAKANGNYNFSDVYKGHYMLSADITGVDARSKLIYVDNRQMSEYKTVHLSSEIYLFPNPASEYTILNYENTSDNKQIQFQIISVDGKILWDEMQDVSAGLNYIRIDLQDFPQGLMVLHIIDGSNIVSKRILHK